MSVKQLYEHVTIRVPLDTRRFIDYLNETLLELSSLYNDFVFKPGEEGTVIININQELPTRPPYFAAIVYNILYLCGYDTNGTYKSEFIRLSQETNSRIKSNELRKKRHYIRRTGW